MAAIVLVAAGTLVLAIEARHLTFDADDWQFILQRRGFSAETFFAPHLQHLSALPVLAYKVLLAVFGASSYAPFMALLLATHAAACVLLYAVARRYLGPWVALIPTAILLLLGPAWNDLLWAFQIGYFGSVAAGFGMVLCLERHDRSGDIGASALLIVSLLCSSIGLGMVIVAAVLVTAQRPHTWRRVWIWAVPLGLYLVWYEVYGVPAASSQNIHRIPGYLFQALSAAVASITGLGTELHGSPYLVSTSYAKFIAIAALVLLIVYLLRGHRPPALTWAALAGATALWAAAALAYFPSREPQQSRYQYASAALLLLAVAAIAPGWRPSKRVIPLLGVVSIAIVAANIGILVRRADFWRVNSAYNAAEAGAMEVARPVVAPSYAPTNFGTFMATGRNGLLSVTAGSYFSGIDAFGSSADRPRDILRRSEEVREAADLVLAQAERVGLRLAAPGVPAGPCRLAPTGTELGELAVGPGTLTVRVTPGASAELQLRRFASRYRLLSYGNPPPVFGRFPALADGRPRAVTLPRDRSAIPWRVRIVGGRGVRVCFTPAAR